MEASARMVAEAAIRGVNRGESFFRLDGKTFHILQVG